MRKALTIIGTVVAGLALSVALSACSDNWKDLEGVNFRDPDKAEGYNNVDGHPNLARICIDGVAFVTTSRDYTSIMRIPEWDGWCKS